jgi:ABC-type multidrug transport system ATPase subunit
VSPVVDVRELEVVYQRGGEPAVTGLDFALGAGESLLLTGEHGSGKTSVLRALLGLAIAKGEISVFGHRPGTPEATQRVGYGPQGRTFTEGHSPAELLDLVVQLRLGRRAPEVASHALERAGLAAALHRVRTTDSEDVRRIALACAIAGDPDLLVLDDPWEFPETAVEIEHARARGAAVLVATDDPGGFAQLLGRAITLVDGVPQ